MFGMPPRTTDFMKIKSFIVRLCVDSRNYYYWRLCGPCVLFDFYAYHTWQCMHVLCYCERVSERVNKNDLRLLCGTKNANKSFRYTFSRFGFDVYSHKRVFLFSSSGIVRVHIANPNARTLGNAITDDAASHGKLKNNELETKMWCKCAPQLLEINHVLVCAHRRNQIQIDGALHQFCVNSTVRERSRSKRYYVASHTYWEHRQIS